MSAPLDAFSIITISNEATAPTLYRISFAASAGQWHSLPRSQIAPDTSASFVLGAVAGASEGQVVYRREPGVALTVRFRCSAAGNSVVTTPADAFSVTFNATQVPLVANVRVLRREGEVPDGR